MIYIYTHTHIYFKGAWVNEAADSICSDSKNGGSIAILVMVWMGIIFYGKLYHTHVCVSNCVLFFFSPRWTCVWTIITLSNFELLVQPAAMKKHLKHSNFSFFKKKFSLSVSCQYTRFYKKKGVNVLKKGGKMVGNRQTPKIFWKTDKVKTFV